VEWRARISQMPYPQAFVPRYESSPGREVSGPLKIKTSRARARCKKRTPQTCKLHGEWSRASRPARQCNLHIGRGSDRSHEGSHGCRMFLYSPHPPRPAGGQWRGAYGVICAGCFMLAARGRPSHGARGTSEANEWSENLAMRALPSKTKANYVTIIYAGAWQCHLDWRRLGRLPARHHRSGAIASRLTAGAYGLR
jgi:hypothetical protein